MGIYNDYSGHVDIDKCGQIVKIYVVNMYSADLFS